VETVSIWQAKFTQIYQIPKELRAYFELNGIKHLKEGRTNSLMSAIFNKPLNNIRFATVVLAAKRLP
jgi:hypothetical protein